MAYGFDPNVDYSLLIKKKLEEGDYAGAAVLEQQRNEKIDTLKLPYEKTYDLIRYLPDERKDLASELLSGVPKYESRYQADIDAALEKILNPQPFSYDYASDPLYRQYSKQYIDLGRRAMEDTLGKAAAMTGGLASSYAASAGAQAYDYYMQQLAGKIPELEQYAYGKYRDQLGNLYNTVSLLGSLESESYGRHRDSVSDYWSALNAANAISQQDIENIMAQQQYADTRADTAFEKAAALLKMGLSSPEIARALGITEEQASEYIKMLKESGGGSGGGGYGAGGYGGGGSGGAGKMALPAAPYGIVDTMLNFQNDAYAYEYLVRLGLDSTERAAIWDLYLKSKAPQNIPATTTWSSGKTASVDPALAQLLGNRQTIIYSVKKMAENGASKTQIRQYLQQLVKGKYISQKDMETILSAIS